MLLIKFAKVENMKIKIIGPGENPVFQDIRDIFLKADHQLQVEATIDKVTRLEDIQQYPLAVYPAIVIDGQLMCEGLTITLELAKKCILENLEKSGEKP